MRPESTGTRHDPARPHTAGAARRGLARCPEILQTFGPQPTSARHTAPGDRLTECMPVGHTLPARCPLHHVGPVSHIQPQELTVRESGAGPLQNRLSRDSDHPATADSSRRGDQIPAHQPRPTSPQTTFDHLIAGQVSHQ